MPNRSRKEHEVLAEKISLWAIENQQSDSRHIQDLLKDINSTSNWNYWSSLEANDLLPKLSSLNSKRLRDRYQKFLFFRNLLVFLPVTITWIAISEASSKFSEFTAANEGSVVNFLQFWQDGYGYLLSVWRLSSVALIDFLILALIMVLTIILQLVSSQAEKLESIENERDYLSRGVLIREIFDFFSRNQKITGLNFDKTLANSLRDLSKSTRNLEQITKELNKSVKGFPTYLKILREIKTLNQEVRKLKNSRD